MFGRTQSERFLTSSPAAATSAPMRKTGILLKQRDFMKGWRQRFFILENKMLYYYKQQRDPLPRGTVSLENVRVCRRQSGCCLRLGFVGVTPVFIAVSTHSPCSYVQNVIGLAC